jgi:topoisomerase-4 subunit A
LLHIIFDELPRLSVSYLENEKGRKPDDEEILVADFIAVKSYKAKGKRLSNHAIEQIQLLEPLEPEIPEESPEELEETEEILQAEIPAPVAESDEITQKEAPKASSPDPKENGPIGPVQMELDF